MATLKRASDQNSFDWRAAVLAEWRQSVAQLLSHDRVVWPLDDGTCFADPLPSMLEDLEAGLPVTVYGWEMLATWRRASTARPPRWLLAGQRYALGGDGAVQEVGYGALETP